VSVEGECGCVCGCVCVCVCMCVETPSQLVLRERPECVYVCVCVCVCVCVRGDPLSAGAQRKTYLTVDYVGICNIQSGRIQEGRGERGREQMVVLWKEGSVCSVGGRRGCKDQVCVCGGAGDNAQREGVHV